MKREEATKLIKEIDEECRDIRGTSLLLMAPNESDILSHGYQVHIKMNADWKKLRCLQTIAEQYGYVVKNEVERGTVVVYRPMKQKSAIPQQNPAMPSGFA